MAFIEKKNPVVLNIKLTSKGRELLAAGQLDFKYYAVGDSEVDYDFSREVEAVDAEYSPFYSSILQPADNNPNQISFISRNVSGDPYNLLSTVPVTAYSVENQVESIGFFTNSGNTFITDSNHVKQPDAMVDMTTATGGTTLKLLKAPTYGTSGEEPAVGDILLIKWTHSINTTGHTVYKNTPTPYLWYRIDGIGAGSLAGAGINITVDRELPNFSGLSLSGIYAGAMIYYNEISFSGSSVFNLSPTDYVDEAVISFLENSQCPTVIFPYWNMSIIYTEEIAGPQAGKLKYTQFKNRKFGGFVSYIQNQAPVNKKLGVIHYTNSSPANVYGEGFLLNTPVLDIPTIMWHKSSTQTLGTQLTPLGSQQTLTGLDLKFYDLADPQGFVVGKVFPELKIFVIEDQELLYAMEYKTNRSWTLPDYTAGTTETSSSTPASTVCWTTPVNQDPGIIKIVSQCYCYVSGATSSGWIPFPTTGVGSTVFRTNVVDAGYKAVGGVDVVGALYGEVLLSICAYDYINSYCLPGKTCTVYGDPGSSTLPATLSCVNHTNNYCFGGCICHDN